MPIKFEALLTPSETILAKLTIHESSELIFENNTVYSALLDEILSYKKYTCINDNVSTLYLFYLTPEMYSMYKYHNIGFKSFKDAILVIEIYS